MPWRVGLRAVWVGRDGRCYVAQGRRARYSLRRPPRRSGRATRLRVAALPEQVDKVHIDAWLTGSAGLLYLKIRLHGCIGTD